MGLDDGAGLETCGLDLEVRPLRPETWNLRERAACSERQSLAGKPECEAGKRKREA